MRDEDTLQTSYKNISERMLVLNIMLFVALPMLLSVFDFSLSQDVLILTGLASIFNLIAYQRHATTYREGAFFKFLLTFSPYVLLAIIAIVALGTPLLSEIVVGKSSYLSLDRANEALLVSASDSFKDVVVSQLKILAISSIALSIYFICDSIYILRKVSFCVLLSTFIFCLFGFILQYCSVESNIFVINKLGDNSFFTFIESRHWCVYACLCLAISSISASYSMQKYKFWVFMISRRFFALCMQLLILLSVYLIGIDIYTLLASVLILMSVLIIMPSAFPSRRPQGISVDEDWQASSSLESNLVFLGYLLVVLGLLVLIFFAAKGVIANGAMLSSFSAAEEACISFDIAPLLEARPIFGWGSASFSEIFALSQTSDMGTSLWAYPYTDFDFARLEIGYIGIALLFISPIVLLISASIKGNFKWELIPLALVVLSVLAISLYSTPLQSPLVVAVFAVSLSSLLSLLRVEN